MKTSTLTPKELGKKRIVGKRLKIMEIPENEGNFINKENKYPIFINNINKSTFKKHDREVKENQRNPFDIPENMRLFSSGKRSISAKPDPFIMSEPRSICDTDPTFYDIIKGRSIRPKTDIKVYVKHIRDITQSKADAAYLKEAMVLLDSKIATEKAEYSEVRKLYRKHQINFVKFIKESYMQVKVMQILSEKKATDLANMTEQLEAYSIQYVKLRNLVSNLSFNIETRAIYARFLNSFAPDWWKEEYTNTNESNLVQFDEFGNLVHASLSSLHVSKMRISKRIKNLYLFFMEPKELMIKFDTLERQCANYIQIDVQTSSVRKILMKKRDVLKDDIATSITEMEDFINILAGQIKSYEEKEVEYKKLFEKILITEFYDLYVSFDSGKLFTCVQYVNMNILGNPEDPQDSVVTLMHQLEGLYLSLTLALDNLDQDVLKTISDTVFAKDIVAMKRAHKAQRYLKEADILSKALYKSFEPPSRRQNINKLVLSNFRYDQHGLKK